MKSRAEDWLWQPIPDIPGIEHRKTVRIRECGEPLVPLSALAPNLILVRPEYYLAGYKSALNECYVRGTVGEKLVEAARLLPHGLRLLVLDGWRPLALQAELFERQRRRVKESNPHYTDEQVAAEAEIHVSLPADDPSLPPPHLTGGAVDLKICDERGKPLPMEPPFDCPVPESRTRYYEEKLAEGKALTRREREFLRYRRLLYNVLTRVGFTNYVREWWHFDYGDQFWGAIVGRESIYGRADLTDLPVGKAVDEAPPAVQPLGPRQA
jgi:D-alanyl-D-alanine dipeptidase